MPGCSVKSSKYFYYACHNYCKRGKKVCDAGIINKDKLESFVIDRIKANMLTRKNLTELMRLTNAEIDQAKDEYQERRIAIDGQPENLRERLHVL